jgi:hypothetical protein
LSIHSPQDYLNPTKKPTVAQRQALIEHPLPSGLFKSNKKDYSRAATGFDCIGGLAAIYRFKPS